jgi:hypothetical protein
LLLDEPSHPEWVFQWPKTYLCEPVDGEEKPGFEPELEAESDYLIVEVRWFDLRVESTWDPALIEDPFSYSLVQRVRKVLVYLA